MKLKSSYVLASLLVVGFAATARADSLGDEILRDIFDTGAYTTDQVAFPGNDYINSQGGDPNVGKQWFGIRTDPDGSEHVDNTLGGVFSGASEVYEGCVTPNGKVCASCHRPESNFKLPKPPIVGKISPSDPLLTGQDAEAQGDPRAKDYFEQLGLTKIRVNRFNPLLDDNTNGYRKVFGWRKTQTIINLAFSQSLLTDGRARHGIEQARGAAFTHTQSTDKRFDDIVNPKLPNIAAYQMTEFTDPALKDLLDPSAPLHNTLVNDPFYTVHAKSADERAGQGVFAANCMSCHNTPNVFNNLEHVNGTPPNFPPEFGLPLDIGVAQKNAHHLDFREYVVATNSYAPIVLQLVKQDGTVTNWTVTDDLGAAFVSARYEDLHRFRVPQLRGIKNFAPYFHDDSAATLDDVVDYFNSSNYNSSEDGKYHPIHLSSTEHRQLVAFLNIL